jgi:hypothetical protein
MQKGESEPIQQVDIFNRHYEGSMGYQGGRWVVSAASLDAEGKAVGGGIVSTFDDLELAKKCMTEIRTVNPNHKPTVVSASTAFEN